MKTLSFRIQIEIKAAIVIFGLMKKGVGKRVLGIKLLFLVVDLLLRCSSSRGDGDQLTFALVPKSLTNPFFQPAERGCKDQAQLLGVDCIYTGSDYDATDGHLQADVLRKLIVNNTIDGIAVSAANTKVIAPLIDQAVDNGIPVVTFDSDAPNSKRAAYIGTNNRFFGKQIAKLLKQLHPEGGSFAIVSVGDVPNIIERELGFREEVLRVSKENKKPIWHEIEGSPSDCKASISLAVRQMKDFASYQPTAIVPLMGGPMRSVNWQEFIDHNRFMDVTVVSGDAMPNQLNDLHNRYVDGLVGQLPYEMGSIAIQVLHDLIKDGTLEQEIYGTNVVTHMLVPLNLPRQQVNHNLIGDLVYTGYILFGLITVSSIYTFIWTFRNCKNHIVRSAQPVFLAFVSLGVLITGSSIVPLSFDDGGDVETNNPNRNWICMSVPWLASTGFTIIFSALFTKTLRVNRIFRSRVPYARITVREKDVIINLFLLLVLNFIVLTCWSVFDPLTYVREDHDGTDGWNRVISTYGACQSEAPYIYLIPLAAINMGVLVLANWQAYVAKGIRSEFSEARYITIAMASLLQAGLTGIPILFVVRSIPKAYYLVLVFMIFVTCMAVLILIFVPKIVLKDAYARQGPQQQRMSLRNSIRLSQRSLQPPASSLMMADPSSNEMGSNPGFTATDTTLSIRSSVANSKSYRSEQQNYCSSGQIRPLENHYSVSSRQHVNDERDCEQGDNQGMRRNMRFGRLEKIVSVGGSKESSCKSESCVESSCELHMQHNGVKSEQADEQRGEIEI